MTYLQKDIFTKGHIEKKDKLKKDTFKKGHI